MWSAFLSMEGRMKRQSWKRGLYLPLVFLIYGLGTGETGSSERFVQLETSVPYHLADEIG